MKIPTGFQVQIKWFAFALEFEFLNPSNPNFTFLELTLHSCQLCHMMNITVLSAHFKIGIVSEKNQKAAMEELNKLTSDLDAELEKIMSQKE